MFSMWSLCIYWTKLNLWLPISQSQEGNQFITFIFISQNYEHTHWVKENIGACKKSGQDRKRPMAVIWQIRDHLFIKQILFDHCWNTNRGRGPGILWMIEKARTLRLLGTDNFENSNKCLWESSLKIMFSMIYWLKALCGNTFSASTCQRIYLL